MSSFFVLYGVEYVLWCAIIIEAIPYVKRSPVGGYSMPNRWNFDFDFTLIYFMLLGLSLPYFCSTYLYLHRKRQQQLYSVYGTTKKLV